MDRLRKTRIAKLPTEGTELAWELIKILQGIEKKAVEGTDRMQVPEEEETVVAEWAKKRRKDSLSIW